MSLVQSILSNYNILNYQNDFLLFHCSRNEGIRSPFEGECTKVDDNTCMICNDDIKLYIYHISDIVEGHVKKNDIIGYPIVSLINGDRIAYIGLKLYDNKDCLCNILTYKKQEVKKSTKRKSTTKKKK